MGRIVLGGLGNRLSTVVSFWIVLFSIFYIKSVNAKIVYGHLLTGENWKFLARFCFLSDHGKFTYDIRYDASYGVQNIDLYYDTESQWSRVYGDSSDLTTCRQKESVLKPENNQFINLTTKVYQSNCFEEFDSISTHTYIRCNGTRNFNTARERWWFVAVSNCNSTKGLYLQYKFVMTNGPRTDLIHHHFSADEFYILPILIVAAILQMSILFMSIWSAIVLKSRQLLHATYKLFLTLVFLHTIGTIFLVCHYLMYALDGIGLNSTKLNGKVLEAAAEFMFVLLLILIAKGYTVTRARLPQASAMKLTVFACSYAVTYVSLFTYETLHFDRGQVLYIYESMAGYGLIILRSVGWCMFIYSTFFTLKHYPEKGGFYYPYFSYYTLWFVAGPCIILIANHIIADWVREKVVISVEHFVIFSGHIVFLMLTRPSAHNKNFPYHVRTTQIGIMEAMTTNTHLGPNTLDHFVNGGSYGVSAPATGMDVFTVDSASRVPPPPYLPPSATSMSASSAPPRSNTSSAPPTSNGLPPWSITNHSTVNGGVHSNGNAAQPKIYDPNDDEDEDD